MNGPNRSLMTYAEKFWSEPKVSVATCNFKDFFHEREYCTLTMFCNPANPAYDTTATLDMTGRLGQCRTRTTVWRRMRN
jgi:hypothetical protein